VGGKKEKWEKGKDKRFKQVMPGTTRLAFPFLLFPLYPLYTNRFTPSDA
jgi:hypothetical protein